jgi:hypothetical protein
MQSLEESDRGVKEEARGSGWRNERRVIRWGEGVRS